LLTICKIPTRGGKPNTSFLFPTFSSDITPSGHLRIKPTLQLASETHIFAAGDVIDWEEQHQAAKTYAHADTITANVQSVLKGEDAKAKYKGSLEMILVTVGKEGGALYMGILWGLV
jgi:apoptosis-inducing factor 2